MSTQEQMLQRATEDLGGLMKRAWTDESYKARLIADPHTALKEAGIAVPSHVSISVLENSPDRFFLVLPEKPGNEISEADLDSVHDGIGLLALAGAFVALAFAVFNAVVMLPAVASVTEGFTKNPFKK